MNEEKIEKAIEILSSAHYNLGNLQRVGMALLPMVKKQIESGIKELDPEWEPID